MEEVVVFLLLQTAKGNAILEVLASLKMDFIFPHQFSASLLQLCILCALTLEAVSWLHFVGCNSWLDAKLNLFKPSSLFRYCSEAMVSDKRDFINRKNCNTKVSLFYILYNLSLEEKNSITVHKCWRCEAVNNQRSSFQKEKTIWSENCGRHERWILKSTWLTEICI